MFPSRALVRRELMTTLRRARVLVWIVLLMLCAISVIWLNWPDQGATPSRVSDQMTEILTWLAAVLMGGCILFVPSIAAAAIVSEREQDTLDLLRMSMVRASGIVSAKLLNAVGIFALLLITVAPAIGATLFGVGLERTVILQVLVVLFTVALTCAFAGLASSAFFRRTIWAVIGAYGFTAAAMVLPGLFFAMIRAFLYVRPEYGAYLEKAALALDTAGQLRNLDDEAIVLLAMPPTSILAVFAGNSPSGWWVLFATVLQIPIWMLFAWLTMRWLRKRDPHAVVDDEKPIDDLEVLKARREQFPYYLIDPLKRKKPIEDSRNPMFVREVRWGLFSRMTVLMRLCLTIFAAFFIGALFPVLYDRGRSTDSEIIQLWAYVQYLVTMVFAPALVANTFTKERELGNLDMMRMTLLSPRQILAGKAGAGLIVLSPVIVAVLIASFPLLFIGLRALPELGRSVLTGLIWAGFCVAISITVSLFAKRTVGALITSYAIIGFTFLIINPLSEFLWHRTTDYRNMPWQDRMQADEPVLVTYAQLLNPTNSVLNGDDMGVWIVNAGVSILIMLLCYGAASIYLSRFRMQDR